MRPIAIPSHISRCQLHEADFEQTCINIRKNYAGLLKGTPDISIIIPAYNEAETILGTLFSLSENITSRSVEIIVVNNNSTDKTEQVVNAAGITCILEQVQGVTAARNAGLSYAKGKYILNADADTIYPQCWIEEMIKPLDTNKNIALTYGRFSFIPTGSTSRFTYFFYEYFADFIRWINKYIKDEAVNVYGFNSGFRRNEGLKVDGYDHPSGTNEDGWLALKLRNKGFGKLFYVKKRSALVWTTDRRIQIDGGLWKASVRRLKRVFFKGPR